MRSRTLPASLLLCSFLFSIPLYGQMQPQRPLSDVIDGLLEAPRYQNAIWTAKVVNLRTGETIYSRNAGTSMLPASNGKLYTAAAVLDQLGPDYTYTTNVYTDGELANGMLDGNLYIRGVGDPAIGGHLYYDRDHTADPTTVLRAWAIELRERGVRAISGNIIGDDNLFEDTRLGIGWSWDDEPYYYSAEISALTFNDNSIDLVLQGLRQGEPVTMHWLPFNTDYASIENATITLPAGHRKDNEVARAQGKNSFLIESEIPLGVVDTVSVAIVNPTLYFATIFRDVLEQEGIEVAGEPQDLDDLDTTLDYTQLHSALAHESPPLSELVWYLNKESQNLYAELMVRTLGVERPVLWDEDLEVGTTDMGLAAAMRTFHRAGIDTTLVHLVDGSGLSRMDLVTANMTSALLAYMWNHPDSAVRRAFVDSLPVGGVDGTLDRRFRRGLGRRNVRAKTGTLTGVSSLSGYVKNTAGDPISFVLMVNNHTHKASIVQRTQDAVVNLLAESGR